MPVGLSIALALVAAVHGDAPADPVPPAAAQPVAKPVGSPPRERCSYRNNPDDIVVCAPRQDGYRIDPDVMISTRNKRTLGPPRAHSGRDTSCSVVGPMGCRTAGINVISAVIVAATMVSKAIKGENVGKMFITDPQPNEYQLFVQAKREREEREAAAKVKAKVAEAAAKSPAANPPR
jgi:hypothetical protein